MQEDCIVPGPSHGPRTPTEGQVTSASFPEGPAQGRDSQAEPLWPGQLDSRRTRDRRAELFYWVAGAAGQLGGGGHQR